MKLNHEKLFHYRKLKYYTDLRKLKLQTDKSRVKNKIKIKNIPEI